MQSLRQSLKAPAKVNLFLHITGRRPDGYHLLQSLFCPISLYDHIELSLTAQPGPASVHITRSGDLIHLDEHLDLCVRAVNAYLQAWWQEYEPCRCQVHIACEKHIPEQAGLGGGSSDAAAILLAMNAAQTKPLGDAAMRAIALALGADVPFFLHHSAAFVEGVGEILTPFPPLKGYLLVAKPPLHCPTGKIFSDPALTRQALDVKMLVFDSARRVKQSEAVYDALKQHTSNALQVVVEQLFPEWEILFKQFAQLANQHHACLVRMSGSGSAMFAVFASPSDRTIAHKAIQADPELSQCSFYACEILNGGLPGLENESD